MLKILFALLIIVEILLIPLMIYCLSGISILLPGLGLIISGGLIFGLLFVVEIILFALTFFIYRRLRRDSGNFNKYL